MKWTRWLWATLLASCATAPVPPKPTPTRTATVAEAPPPEPPEVEPQEKVEPPRQIEAALALVERGRAVQRDKGEDGAEEAAGLYREALELDPRSEAAYWELGWSYQVLDRWDDAVAAWDALKAINAAYPELEVHYPVALMRRDQARALAALPDPGTLPPPEETPREGPTIRLRAVGDVQLGRAWPPNLAALPEDPLEMFEDVKALLADADITFGNLETVLADEGESKKCSPRSTKCYAFRAPTAFAAALKSTGFDVMSIANNHTGDYGEEGRVTTVKALDAVGILHSGPVGDVASWQTNGLKIALVAFATGGGLYRVQDVETAVKVVADLDRSHDLVFVSFHGGAEGIDATHVAPGTEMFLGEDRGDLRRFTRAVIDAGADLVLGHGPHVWRAMERYKGRLIVYSMGNFCAWEGFSLRGPLGISGILEVKLATNGVLLEAQVMPVVLEGKGLPRPDEKKQLIPRVRALGQEDFGHPVLDEEGRIR